MIRSRARLSLTAAVAIATLLVGPVLPTAATAAEPVVVLTSDFETTADPWTGRGATVAMTDAAAHGGTQSLGITGRTNGWNGAAIDGALFEPGVEYTVSAWVRLLDPAGAATGVNLGINQPGAANEYPWVGSRLTVGADWVQLTGTFVNDAAHPVAQLYLEAESATAGLLLDDVLITAPESPGPGGPEPGTIVLGTDFEDGLAGWAPRDGGPGAPTVALSTTAHGGAQSAVVTDRMNQGAGIGHDMLGLLEAGVTYEVSAWVRFAEPSPGGELWLSLQRDANFATLGQFTGITADGWTQVTATFTMGAAETTSLLYFETPWEGEGVAGDTSDFLVDDVVVRVPEPAVIEDLTPIKDTQPYPVGVAIDSRETSGPASDLLLRHFDQITAENHMKPEAWYDEAGVFRAHPDADALMQFAVDNDLRVYGHVLVWHSQTPAWFFQNDAGEPLGTTDADKQALRDRLHEHIFAIAEDLSTKYGLFGDGNPLVAFDVVNEVVSDSADFADGLRRSEWYRILGEEFIDLAFRYADEAFNQTYAAAGTDRPVTLFINDYNTEQSGKRLRYKALVERLLSRGVPVDGVGHQFHVNLAMPISALEQAITAFGDLPVTQAVTEFDVPTGTPVTDALLVEQGYYFRDAFRVFRAHAGDLFHVTVWGLTDGRSWRSSNGAPLVFDDGYQAKPAYHGIVDGELPERLRTANVFQGDVAVDDAAPDALAWRQLPLHDIDGVAGFQLRWQPDHLTAYVTVTDATADAADTTTFTLGEATYVVARDGSGDVPAIARPTADGYHLVAHLPLEAAASGDALAFDVSIADGATTWSWNSPGALGTLTLIEPLSYLEVAETSAAPAVDGAVDAAWTQATAVETGTQVQGTGTANAQVRTLWQEGTLYVLAEVADPVIDVSGSDPWIQDSVELYVDPGNAKNGSYRYDDMQVRISAENVVSFGTGDEAFQQARVQSATATVDGGYVVEAAIDLLEYGGAATFHGLDFQVNDAAEGARLGIRNWADPTGTGYQSTARWGVGQLVTAPPVDERVESAVIGLPHSLIARQNKRITYTAIVLAAETPTGEVTVYDGDTALATATLDRRGTARLQLPPLSRGVHRLWVQFHGSDRVKESASVRIPVLIL